MCIRDRDDGLNEGEQTANEDTEEADEKQENPMEQEMCIRDSITAVTLRELFYEKYKEDKILRLPIVKIRNGSLEVEV